MVKEILAHLESIKKSALKIYDIMDQFKSLSRPVFKDYLEGVKMIDLSKARADKEMGLTGTELPPVPPITKTPERQISTPGHPATPPYESEAPAKARAQNHLDCRR